MNKIFLSHISEEAPIAIVLKDWLESSFAGQCEVFVSSDKSSNPPGSRWLDLVDRELSEAKAFIVLCSLNSLHRPWINFETGCGWIKRVPIIPICHTGQKAGHLPMPISLFQGIELESSNFVDDLLKSLARHLGIQKLPRINKAEMQQELQQAVKNITVNAPSLIPPASDQSQLEQIELDILCDLANFRSDQRTMHLEPSEARAQLQTKYSLNPTKLQYYLDRLEKLGLAKHVSIGGLLSYYDVTPEGREMLFNSGRLD